MNKKKILFLALGSAGAAVVRNLDKDEVGADILLIDTDMKALRKEGSFETLLIGRNIFKGLGSGRVVLLAKKAIEESFEHILLKSEQYDKVVIVAGIGGGTGGTAGYLTERLVESGLSVGVSLIYPFPFESHHEKADLLVLRLVELDKQLLFLNVDKTDGALKELEGSLLDYMNSNDLKILSKTIGLLET